jgi:transcriptional regulator with XRE-family HTH domain
VNPLQELIRTRMAEQHWSFADVARRGALPRSTVHHLATNERPSRPPHPQTIARLAEGLDLPVDQVRTAAAQAAGYTVTTAASKDPDVEILVAALGRLGHEDRRHVAALVHSLLENGSGVGGDARSEGVRQSHEPLPDPRPQQ